MTLLESVLAQPSCVLSVMRDHAGENTNTVFNRKIADINRLGKTFEQYSQISLSFMWQLPYRY